ncbi:unnamed protein product [Fusarium graminearum]|uniref:Uncharacterized protein n=1 Tax=Gibberella zeae TaxID=5518 RepID=A0A4E9DV53_GIBZA|nr:unnamed protein product [Fusarium graminearum]CAG1978196.1 unnamed protein product [Fusarium graminearum]CAG1981384.1 unnamed protein product [Fusarium graminearum]
MSSNWHFVEQAISLRVQLPQEIADNFPDSQVVFAAELAAHTIAKDAKDAKDTCYAMDSLEPGTVAETYSQVPHRVIV